LTKQSVIHYTLSGRIVIIQFLNHEAVGATCQPTVRVPSLHLFWNRNTTQMAEPVRSASIPVKLAIAILCLAATWSPLPAAGNAPPPVFQLLEPAAGTTVVSRRPLIRFAFTRIEQVSGYIAILDNIDISALVVQEGEAFSYTPMEPLPSGQHTLTIVAYAQDGSQQQSEAVFASRHSRLFDEATSRNKVGAVLRSRLKNSGDTDREPNTLLDAQPRFGLHSQGTGVHPGSPGKPVLHGSQHPHPGAPGKGVQPFQLSPQGRLGKGPV
jgi:hypothetical protein